MLIPIEIHREITLLYLSEAFWDLIVEPPGVDKNWDPLSSLLHTSSQFRQVTTDYIRPIFGEPSLPESTPSIANYRGILAELKRINAIAHTGDPRELLDTARATSVANTPPDCKSPLLQLARLFAEVVLQLRLCEPEFNSHFGEGSRIMAERANAPTYAKFYRFIDDVPGSVQWRVFMRILSRLVSLFLLVGRTMCLKLSVATAITWFPAAWLLPSSLYTPGSPVDRIITGMIQVMKSLKNLRQDAFARTPIQGLICEDLPTSPAVFEAVHLQEVWRRLEPPSGFAGDDPRVDYCRQTKAEITSFLSAAERDALLSAWRIRQESGGDQAVVVAPEQPIGL
ncbi:hypothetical protein EWM64_g9423 [Hericium alpestre]|uniref:Uncharacterized protein n=1 Tax=Hericium alpestre TaxID=135208 RepID=A0A4Y9ZM45_9AGAM|nr:hypothetical protein EWM64_g9423 [Hericium alpestre]